MLIWRLESEHGAVYRSRPLIDSHSQTELSLQVIHGEHVDGIHDLCAVAFFDGEGKILCLRMEGV
jgi:hypothetical protein